jgi:hypothetical protein
MAREMRFTSVALFFHMCSQEKAMNRILCLGIVAAAAFTLSLALADDPKAGGKKSEPKRVEGKEPKATEEKIDDKNPSIWMKKKLDYSQNILAGVTSEDFDKIADNARAMKGLGKFEAFVRSRNPAYTRQLQIFNEVNDDIIRQADSDNLEGVALAFTQLTINCINCHKALRQHEKAGGEKK